MLTPDERTAVAESMKILRIILFALMMSVITFLLFLIVHGGERVIESSMLAPLGAGFAALALVTSLVLPPIMAEQQRRAVADGNLVTELLGGLQTRTIVRAALLEGAAFFNAFAYMQERQAYSLGIVIALLLAMAMLFPFRRIMEERLERELRTVNELRQLGR